MRGVLQSVYSWKLRDRYDVAENKVLVLSSEALDHDQ